MEASAPYTRIVEVYESLVVDDVYQEWADFVADTWAGGGRQVATLLDIGCGTGLLAERFIARGVRVSGIDASPEMLVRARDRLGPSVELVHAVLPEVVVRGPFDAAVSTFDTFNYLAPADFTRSLTAIGDVLRPGAILVFDVHTDAMMTFSLENPVISGEQSGWSYELLTSVDVAERSCLSRFAARPVEAAVAHSWENGDTHAGFVEEHTQYFHGDEVIESALRNAGFEVLAVTDEYTSAPLTDRTLRATWTARLVR